MATAKENLEDFITCSVCLEKFEGRDPRSLPCLHAFCLECIQGIYNIASKNKDNKLKDDEFRCPQCTTISSIPGNSVNNYPKFYHATQMQDILAEINKAGNPPHKDWDVCQNDQNEVAGFCFTCKMSYCDPCLETHNTTRRFNDHVNVVVTKSNVKSLICKPHNKPFEAYCSDCCQAACAQCHLTDHRDHSISEFVINSGPPHALPHEFKHRQDSCEVNIHDIETVQKAFNAHVDFIEDQITKHEEMLITQIKDQSQSLRDKLARQREENHRELENTKERFREIDDLIDQARTQMTQIMQPVPELSSLSLHNIDELILDIKQVIPKLPTFKKNVPQFHFTPHTAYVKIGDLSVQKHNLVSWEYTNKTLCDISWAPANIVIAAAGPSRLLEYNNREERLPQLCNMSSVKGSVWSVAINHQQSAIALVAGYLADFACHLYISSISRPQKPCQVIKLPDDFSYRVTFTDGGDLLVYGGNILRKYSIKGKKLWTKETKHTAKYITTILDGTIIVSGDGQMSVHDQDGRWLSSFPRDKATLRDPRGVCADSSGNVFVADAEKQAVLMYAPDGTFMTEVVTVDWMPVHLDLYQDRYLAVSLFDQETLECVQLHIYDTCAAFDL